jgi:hypothetical protein
MFKFYSQIVDTLQRGKSQVRQPRLKTAFTTVYAADGGWFCAPMKISRDTALKIMGRISSRIPDLVVEDEAGQRLELPVAAAAA